MACKISLKSIFPASPITERGRPTILSSDEKTHEKLSFGSSNVAYVYNVKSGEVEFFTDHSEKVTCAKISPSGYYCCSGDEKGFIKVWAFNEDKTIKYEGRPLSQNVNDIAWTPDSQRLSVVGNGKNSYGQVFLYDSGSSVGDISGHSKHILTTDFKPTRPFRLVTGGEDLQLNFYKGPPFKFDHSNIDHKKFVNCIRFSKTGKYFASVGGDKLISIFEGKDGKKLFSLAPKSAFDSKTTHGGAIYSVIWLSDFIFFTTSADKSLKLWNFTEPSEENSGELKCIGSFQFGKDVPDMVIGGTVLFGNRIVAMTLNSDITIFKPLNIEELEKGNEVKLEIEKVIYGHNNLIREIKYEEATNQLFSCGSDGRLIEWDVEKVENKGDEEIVAFSKNRLKMEKLSDKTIQSMATIPSKDSENNGEILVAYMNGEIQGVDMSTLTYINEHKLKIDSVPNEIHVHPNNKSIFFIISYKGLSVFNNWELIGEIEGEKEDKVLLPNVLKPAFFKINAMSISNDGKLLALGGNNNLVYLYEINDDISEKLNLKLLKVFEGHTGPISKLKFGVNGNYLASGDFKKEILVWNLNSLEMEWHNLVFHSSIVSDFDWLNDDPEKGDVCLVSCSLDKTMIGWNLTKEKRTIEMIHTSGAVSLSVTKKDVENKKYQVVTAGKDNCLKVFELQF